MTFKGKHAKSDEGRRDFRPSIRLTKEELTKEVKHVSTI
jgi:hypothetical protein